MCENFSAVSQTGYDSFFNKNPNVTCNLRAVLFNIQNYLDFFFRGSKDKSV